MKKSKKWLIIIAFLIIVLPVSVLILFSISEIQQYKPKQDVFIQEKAYGPVEVVYTRDLEETIVMQGNVVGYQIDLLDVNGILMVEVGDEVHLGDILAKQGIEEYKASSNGIVKAIDVASDGYVIRILNIDKVYAEIISERYDYIFEEEHTYETAEGIELTYIKSGNQIIDGKRTYYFDIDDSFIHGQSIELHVMTGRMEESVLVVNKEAVYEKSDGKKYVRIVDQSGNVLEERNVQTGLEDSADITVSNVRVGEYVDVGYGKYQNEINRGDGK